jgi:hypothetical protein
VKSFKNQTNDEKQMVIPRQNTTAPQAIILTHNSHSK